MDIWALLTKIFGDPWNLAQLMGVHTILGLSAYVVLLTGQVTMA